MYSFSRILMVNVLVAAVLATTTGFAVDAFETGRDWSKWKAAARLAYVSAYIHGQGRGFRDGCVAGQQIYSVTKPSGLPGEACVGKAPSYSKKLEDYVSTITAYYRSYPSDENVPIIKVLEDLSDTNARSIQQMHDYFSPAMRKGH